MNELTPEEFVVMAIKKLRTGQFKGIHSVFSGFNEAFKTYFSGADPVQVTNELAQDGKIVLRPVRGGVILYLPEDAPRFTRGELALQKMGLLNPPASARKTKDK